MEKHIKDAMNDSIRKEACSFYGIELADLKELDGFESYIYEFHLNNQDYIMRISHKDHRLEELIYAEMEFLFYLAEHGGNVSTPIKSIHDKLVERIALEDDKYFNVACFTKAKGQYVSKNDFNPKFYQYFGESVGKLHKLSKVYKPVHRRFHYNQDPVFLEAVKHLPKDKLYIADKYKETMDLVYQYPQTPLNYGLAHMDLHFSNMFYDQEEGLTFFDFDDCMYMYYAKDIAMILYYLSEFTLAKETWEDKNRMIKEFYDHFMTGYLKHHTLTKEDISYIPHYMNLRVYDLYVIIYRSYENVDEGWHKDFLAKCDDIISNNKEIFDYSIFR